MARGFRLSGRLLGAWNRAPAGTANSGWRPAALASRRAVAPEPGPSLPPPPTQKRRRAASLGSWEYSSGGGISRQKHGKCRDHDNPQFVKDRVAPSEGADDP